MNHLGMDVGTMFVVAAKPAADGGVEVDPPAVGTPGRMLIVCRAQPMVLARAHVEQVHALRRLVHPLRRRAHPLRRPTLNVF